MTRLILAITLIASSLAAFADDSLPEELPSEQEVPALLSAETTGLTIYRHDQAAAVATDAAFKVRSFKKDKRINGWITEEQQGSVVVTFIDKTPAALYRITVANGVAGSLASLESPTPLTAYEAGAAAARQAALASNFEPCSSSYNSVVLPSPVDGNWLVYLIPGTTKNNIVPIGGTYRMEISGSNIVSQRAFTRTCISLQTDPRAAALVVTHLLDPIPTEAHVFWSIWAQKPLYVSTPPNGTLWLVEGNNIKLVERKPADG
ncbi:hypothetical protein [Pseudoxanthomonas wuyuanensis]|uniref:Uncharacterized protein n=1 Tax=Pseudoxanthomonas wuyuanensis TaxID=1073196 RepID=A0A286CW14_9GAMM|nr:hypothetical protein [Pseudoxanthomonas wuyuanensis]SOD50583.1 hypothetical protein SAMN06296416_101194 [Pseudoxanthomonas wuyuanensis]